MITILKFKLHVLLYLIFYFRTTRALNPTGEYDESDLRQGDLLL